MDGRSWLDVSRCAFRQSALSRFGVCVGFFASWNALSDFIVLGNAFDWGAFLYNALFGSKNSYVAICYILFTGIYYISSLLCVGIYRSILMSTHRWITTSIHHQRRHTDGSRRRPIFDTDSPTDPDADPSTRMDRSTSSVRRWATPTVTIDRARSERIGQTGQHYL